MRTANHLKSNQPQSTKGRGIAELSPQSTKKTDEPRHKHRATSREKRIKNLRLFSKIDLVSTVIYIYKLQIRPRTQSPNRHSQTITGHAKKCTVNTDILINKTCLIPKTKVLKF